MVTSPNWMAPFHIARATAGPRAVVGRVATGGPSRPGPHDTRLCNRSASRRPAAASTEDDERIEVDAAGAGEAELDGVCREGRERRRIQDDPAVAPDAAEADRGPVPPVDVDRGTAA